MVVEAQAKLISAAEFWDIAHAPEYDDQLVELVEGVVVTMSRPGWKHGVVTGELYFYVRQHVKIHNLGYVSVESGFILFKNPGGKDTVFGPDVAFVRLERAPQGLPESGYAPFPPDLAVEVVSPNDKVYDISDKVDVYLRAGTQLVWVVDPSSRTVIVHRPDGIAAYDLNGVLDGGSVLPGFTLAVRDIFPAN